MVFKRAILEIFRNKGIYFLFILNLSLGLAGFLSVEAFKEEIRAHLQKGSKELLSADLAISARRQISQDESEKIKDYVFKTDSKSLRTEIYEFFAMTTSQENNLTRLVLVKTIDENYPFYGNLKVETQDSTEDYGEKTLPLLQRFPKDAPLVFVYKDLALQMNLSLGQKIKLGSLEFEIKGIVTQDATQTFRSASLAPKVFIPMSQLKKTELIQFGSTFTHSFLFKLPQIVKESELNKIQEDLFKILPDPAIQIDTPTTASEDSNRQLTYLTDFLGLVALVALLLSAFGAAYLFQVQLQRKAKDIAIMQALGLDLKTGIFQQILQLILLGVIALIPSWILASIFIPILSKVLNSLTPISLNPSFSIMDLVFVGSISIFVSLFVGLPLLVQLKNLRLSHLLQESQEPFKLEGLKLWFFIPALLSFWGLSVFQANSWQSGSFFMLGLLGVFFICGVLGLLILKGIESTLLRKGYLWWPIRQGLLGATRRPLSSLILFVSLGLGSMTLSLLPQLKSSIQNDLLVSKDSPLPSLFLFDIQDDQLEPLKEETTRLGQTLQFTSPMVRSRLLKINGEPYERDLGQAGFRTREEEREARIRNRGINLSYRPQLSNSEWIIEGSPLEKRQPDDNNPVDLSVEYRYAERMNLKIGDKLLFDVQGLEILGEVKNFRRVKWTSFQPNFFILMQEGVLNEAPKTHLAALGSMNDKEKIEVMGEIVERFPNISIIDVGRLVTQVLKIADQMSWSLELMAGLCLFTGFLVLFSIIQSQVSRRRYEINMAKIFGAETRPLFFQILSEFLCISLSATAVGTLCSLGVSALLSIYVFSIPLKVHWLSLLLILVFVGLISMVLAYMISRSVVQERPLRLLRDTQ